MTSFQSDSIAHKPDNMAYAVSRTTGSMSKARRVGVVGGGQLAWMMADGAATLQLDLIIQTPSASDPAVAIATETILAPVADAKATANLALRCDVITFENEFIDLHRLAPIEDAGTLFCPRLDALRPLLDKYDQRCYLQSIGLPTPRFITLEDEDDADRLTELGFPVVLKTRRHGYDGQGTFILKTLNDLAQLWQKLNYAPVLLEEFVPFQAELAVMAARSRSGEIAVYPVVVTEQENQVCHRVFAPANVESAIADQVQEIAKTLLTQLDVVGIFGIELFLTPDNRVLVNEIAPRTHNSGHYTLDASETSQFEQQLRAVCGYPLGSVAFKNCQAAVMVNLLGFEHSQSDYAERRQQLAQIPGAAVHWYGKADSRPGRKLGHATILLDQPDWDRARQLAAQAEQIWYGKA